MHACIERGRGRGRDPPTIKLDKAEVHELKK
jgi:hypothetical protein